ncbi:flagellar protein FlaG [Paenibacillus sp. FSL R5-0407]|uniref:flagellar protein FlaG n=1 Tax=Paenibacillus sp. FSL R5-0407 TaxID=2975320 RepID=UPI0030F63763
MDSRITGSGPVIGINNPSRSKNNTSDPEFTGIVNTVTNQPIAIPKTSELDQQEIQRQLEKTILAMQGPEKKLEFSVHQETHTIMVKVFNKETGDLIREIPQEKLLDVAANMMELNGLFIDKKA